MGIDNVDRRLVARFEASREHERVRRELLPPVWISADVDDTGPLGELFEDVLGRARAHVRRERDALAERSRLRPNRVSPARAGARGQSQA